VELGSTYVKGGETYFTTEPAISNILSLTEANIDQFIGRYIFKY